MNYNETETFPNLLSLLKLFLSKLRAIVYTQ